MCLITCNALVRVSHRMVNFLELLHFNFHPDSDLVFLLRRFSLLTRWSFSKPWRDCDLLCWSRTSWRVQVWVPIKVVVFNNLRLCAKCTCPLGRHNTKKKLNLQVPNFLTAASVGSLSCMFILFYCFLEDNVILASDYPFPLGEHHPGKLIEDVYKDDLDLRVREQPHSVSRKPFSPGFDFCPNSLIPIPLNLA